MSTVPLHQLLLQYRNLAHASRAIKQMFNSVMLLKVTHYVSIAITAIKK